MAVTPHLLRDVRDEIEARLPQVCVPVPRLVRMVRVLAGDGLKVAVVTNNTISITVLALSYSGLRASMSAIVCGEDGLPKPAPNLWLQAAQLVGVPPASCLAVDNAPLFLRAVRPFRMVTLCTSMPQLCYEQIRARCDKEA